VFDGIIGRVQVVGECGKLGSYRIDLLDERRDTLFEAVSANS
jgi:hypothetical protein